MMHGPINLRFPDGDLKMSKHVEVGYGLRKQTVVICTGMVLDMKTNINF